VVCFSGHPKSEQWFNRDYSVGSIARLVAFYKRFPPDLRLMIHHTESLLRQSPSAEPHLRSIRPLKFPCSAGNPEI
jgi:hypothetical protein